MTIGELCDDYLRDAGSGCLLMRGGGAKKASMLYADRHRIERHVKPLLGKLSVRGGDAG